MLALDDVRGRVAAADTARGGAWFPLDNTGSADPTDLVVAAKLLSQFEPDPATIALEFFACARRLGHGWPVDHPCFDVIDMHLLPREVFPALWS